MADAVSIPVIASGGVRSVDDVRALKARPGRTVEGAILGRALYDGDIDPAEALQAALKTLLGALQAEAYATRRPGPLAPQTSSRKRRPHCIASPSLPSQLQVPMDTPSWLARCAALIHRIRRKAQDTPTPDPARLERDRLRAARSLRTRLPPHLRRDIGADDG